MANNKQEQAEKKVRKWFNDKVEVMTFGHDKTMSKKLKKSIENNFIKNVKGEN
jgi:hypothetical protein